MTKLITALLITVLFGTMEPAAGPITSITGGGSGERAILSWAFARFAAAGLPLPPLTVEFHDDKSGCGGHDGLYDLATHVDICTPSPTIMLHELAHAWERYHMSQETRNRLMAELGVDVWTDTTVPWNKRASETVAMVVAWGLLAPPLTESQARSFSVQLARFELLTGAASPRLEETRAPGYRRTEELSEEQQSLVDWAGDRFRGAGLEPPEVTFVFHDTLLDCDGQAGMYVGDSDTLHMCRPDGDTILHELGHAWAKEHLSEAARDRFTSHRGLTSWNDHDEPWAERGTEHAAEILAWGLDDRDRTVPWVEDDGSETRNLPTIPNSDLSQLVAAYRLLTGLDPVYRLAG